jgi:hypothetical protein
LKLNPTREPNGRHQRESREPSPTELRRLRDAALRGLRDPEYANELGWLFAQHKITAEMYGAGRRWAQDAAKWRHAIGAFPVRTAALERGHSHPADPDSPEGQEQARRDRDAAERFFDAQAVLVATGSGAERAVQALCERDEAPSFVDLICARSGLSALATHYGLEGQK